MNNFIHYLVEVNISLLVFGLLYLVLLYREGHFKFRRIFILSALVISLCAPAINVPITSNNDINIVGNIETYMLPALNFNAPNQPAENSAVSTETHSNLNTLTGIYGIAASILCFLFIIQLGRIGFHYYKLKSQKVNYNGVTVIETNGTLPTFAFFGIIFFDNSIVLSDDEKARIINHEATHLKEWHSADLILAEIVKILVWFNPIIWYFRNELKELHEFLADRQVIKTTSKDAYSSLLAKMTLRQSNLTLVHHFNKSKTLKRIKMMQIKNTTIKKWKTAFIVPVVALTLFTISCNDEVMQDLENVMETASQTEMPESVQAKFNELSAANPSAKFAYLEFDAESEESAQKLKDIDPKSIAYLHVFKDRGIVGMILDTSGNFQKIQAQQGDGEIFQIVENPAVPEGGYQAFYDRLSSRLIYPNEALKAGVEGKVYVQFIINQIGELTEAQVVKGIGYGCDEAALAAVNSGDLWSPPTQSGKPVKQRIILPITFSLGDNDAPIQPKNEVKNGEVTEIEQVIEINN